jgi:hypothetical protein
MSNRVHWFNLYITRYDDGGKITLPLVSSAITNNLVKHVLGDRARDREEEEEEEEEKKKKKKKKKKQERIYK